MITWIAIAGILYGLNNIFKNYTIATLAIIAFCFLANPKVGCFLIMWWIGVKIYNGVHKW